jgi:hypothetical protein
VSLVERENEKVVRPRCLICRTDVPAVAVAVGSVETVQDCATIEAYVRICRPCAQVIEGRLK